jgi:hypothetical protein
MQISLHTASSAETYVTNHEWRIAKLPKCPLHPKGGCSFARHGSYPRVTPRGLRIARWYCPEGHRTFSLLPDFLAARLPDLLDSIEESVTVAHSAKSLEAAADLVRGPGIGLPGAIRWLRRRVQSVRTALAAVSLAHKDDLTAQHRGLPNQNKAAAAEGIRLNDRSPLTAIRTALAAPA